MNNSVNDEQAAADSGRAMAASNKDVHDTSAGDETTDDRADGNAAEDQAKSTGGRKEMPDVNKIPFNEIEILKRQIGQNNAKILKLQNCVAFLRERLFEEEMPRPPEEPTEYGPRWREIRNQIRILTLSVLKHNGRATKNIMRGNSDEAEIRSLAQLCRARPYSKSFRLEKYIWTRLIHDVFRGQKKVWFGDVGKRFIDFSQALRECHGEDPDLFSKLTVLRSKIAGKLDQFEGPNEEALNEAADSVTKDLSLFFKRHDEEEVRESLRVVWMEAAKLHIRILKSQSGYTITSPDDIYFDPGRCALEGKDGSDHDEGLLWMYRPKKETDDRQNPVVTEYFACQPILTLERAVPDGEDGRVMWRQRAESALLIVS